MLKTIGLLAAIVAVHGGTEPAYTAPGGLHTGTRAHVREMTPEGLQSAVGKHRRFMVLFHDGADKVTTAFQPWLYALANLIPHVPLGRIDLSQKRGDEVAQAFRVAGTGVPAVKLFIRDNPKGQRIINYRGPLDFDKVLDWARAAIDGKEHALSAFGYEPEGADAKEEAAKKAAADSPMSKLPESVRLMAQTMVRETRLQRILKQQGGDRAARYDQMVAQKYAELIQEEKTDLNDKFAVQEANRRARDEVRELLMNDAPVHIREEIEADVSLGDAANQMGGGGGGGHGDIEQKASWRKSKKGKTASVDPPKDEL